jgi:hypothetical protein
MLMSDSYLFDVGWLFFAAWSVIVAVFSLAAFGRDAFGKDILPSQHSAESPQKPPVK